MITREDAFFLQRKRTFWEYLWKAIFSRHQKTQIAQMSQHITPGSCVIDVGANVGFFTRGFARATGKEGVVLAFEPQTVPRSILTTASFFKRNQNIQILPFALGETAGMLTLSIPFKAKGNVGINLAHGGDPTEMAERFTLKSETVPLARLDDVLERYDFGPVSMIKIDVEGAELNVLKGAEATLRKYTPVVICEIDGREHRFGSTGGELVTYLENLGYAPFSLETGVQLDPSSPDRNTVFRHVSSD